MILLVVMDWSINARHVMRPGRSMLITLVVHCRGSSICKSTNVILLNSLIYAVIHDISIYNVSLDATPEFIYIFSHFVLEIVIQGSGGLIVNNSSFEKVLSFNKVLNFRQEIKRILIVFESIIQSNRF